MSLPKLPYMRPIAVSMPIEYESELTYYEYLNNLYSYLNSTVRPAIDSLTPLLDDFPTLKARVDLIQPKVNTLENQFATLNSMVQSHTTTLTNHGNRLASAETSITELDDLVSDLASSLGTLAENVEALTTEFYLLTHPDVRKTTNFTLGEDAWELNDLFPTGTKYNDLVGKKVKIVVTFDSSTNVTANQTQSIMVGGTYGKTENLSKSNSALTTSSVKTYVVEMEFMKDEDICVFLKPYGDVTTFSWYGGMIRIPNTSFTANISGLLTMSGTLGTGHIDVIF